MGFLLGCQNVKVDFPTKQVFESLSLGVNEGDRIGIVGRNGDGKSTLLKLLAGALEPDGGLVVRNGSVRVGLLGQVDSLDDSHTVEQAVVGDMPEYEWAGDARTRRILDSLISDIPWDARVGTLSGGQRRRVDMARLLIGEWDVLALDEPTNHLDIRAISWLAQHLKQRWRAKEGSLLVVTHDRWFLDEVCTQMWEVHDRKVDPFEGGFSAYILQRVERDRLAALSEQKRQNALRRELAWLSRGARARATKPKFHVETARALIADVPELRNPLELRRMAMARIGKQVVDLEQVSVSFDGETVLDRIDWIIGPGDRYGIIGENGVGKTTLLRVIEGALQPTSGQVKIGKTVRFAVLSRHLESLNAFGSDRVRQVIGRFGRHLMLDGKEKTPAQLLQNLGFSRADLNEPVCDLSGGQKRRLALMLILLEEPNVLVLDEPGNDLDTDVLAAVEELLDGWPGTLLLVTHDRYLMERVTDNQFALIEGRLRHLPGGVDEYLSLLGASEKKVSSLFSARRQRSMADEGDSFAASGKGAAFGAASQIDAAAGVAAAVPSQEGASASASPSLATGEAKPRLSGGQIRALKKTVESSERKQETLRGKIAKAKEDMQLIDPTDFEALLFAQGEIDEMQTRLEALEEEWLEAAEQLSLL